MVTKPNQPAPQYPAVELVRKDPKTAALLSKTIANHRQSAGRDEQGNRKPLLPHSYSFKQRLEKRAKRNTDAQMLLKLLPDLELSIQILTSSILSPADMMSTELNYVGPKNLFSAELNGTLLKRLKEYFEEDYKIKPLLSKMLRDILAEKGSYPVAVIPENVIDEFINGDRFISMEALQDFVDEKGQPRALGILGSPTESTKTKVRGLSMEGFPSVAQAQAIDTRLHYALENREGKITGYLPDDMVHVTDNLMVLKFPQLNSVLKKKTITQTIQDKTRSFSLESLKNDLSDQAIEKILYRPRQFQTEHVAVLKSQAELKRHSVGQPLVMKLPSESVIPVHVPGNVEQQIGYFVILDEEGNPIEANSADFYYTSTSKGLDNTSRNSLSSNLINKINTNIGAGNSFDPNNAHHLDFAAQIYADMVERDLIARVKNGVHSTAVQIAQNEEIYRIMLARALSRKYTQILYIPIEYMTYIAFKYGDDGIGKSLLDDSATINTLRSVTMFSDVIASIKNSIGRTQVEMEIPEDDPNPLKTIELAQEEIVRSRQLGIPLGVTNPSDITEFIQRAGYEWAFTGHPGLPALKFTFNNTQSNHAKPDTELQDNLRKASIMAMGLSPETVDSGFNTEFATTVVANNILLSKRIMQYQELFCPGVSDHLRKVALHSEHLITDLRGILMENKEQIKYEIDEAASALFKELPQETKDKILVNRALTDFLTLFEVSLPKPPSVTLENQVEELTTYTDALDKAIEAYISDSFMTETTAGEVSNQLETIKGMIKAHFLRKWLADKGILTELAELTATGEDGQPQLDLMKETTEHIKAMVRSCVSSIAELKPTADAATSDLEALGAEPEPEDMGQDDPTEADASTGAEDVLDTDLDDAPDASESTPPEAEEDEPQADL